MEEERCGGCEERFMGEEEWRWREEESGGSHGFCLGEQMRTEEE